MPAHELLQEGDDAIDLYKAWRSGSRVAEPLWRTWGAMIWADWRAAGKSGRPWASWFDEDPGASHGDGNGNGHVRPR